MENMLKSPGLRHFLIRSAAFMAIGIFTALFISVYFRHTDFFRDYLTIPAEFSIEPPNYRTIFLNSFMVGFIAFIIVSHKKLSGLRENSFEKSQLLYLLLPVFFLFLQYLLKYLIHENISFFSAMPFFWGAVRIIINLCFIGSLALAAYTPSFTAYFIKEYRKEIMIFTAVGLAIFAMTLFFQNLWLVFSSIISHALFLFFSLFFDEVRYEPYVYSPAMAEGGGPLLGINGFSAIIGKPCSGIDSTLYFFIIYLLIVIIDHKRMKKVPMIIGYFLGAIGMFLTNMVRVLLLYMVGAYISPELALGMFHSNIGWILLAVYFFIFFRLARKYIYTD